MPRRYEPEFIAIVSIAPWDQITARQHGVYRIPAAATTKGGEIVQPEWLSEEDKKELKFGRCESTGISYVLRRIWDAEVAIAHHTGHEEDAASPWVPQPVYANVIVDDLLREFRDTQVMSTPNAHLGMTRLTEVNDDKVTPAILERLTAKQDAWFRRLVDLASEAADKREWAAITELHRTAARWLGYEDLPWLRKDYDTPFRQGDQAKREEQVATALASIAAVLANQEAKQQPAMARK